MADHKRGKRAGKRGSTFARSVKAEIASGRIDNGAVCGVVSIVPHQTHDAIKVSSAIYFDDTDTAETVDDPHIPVETMQKLVRRSLTDKLHLKHFPAPVEVEPVKGKQLDKRSGQLVSVTNNRVVWRGDRNLLRRNIPDKLEDIRFTRLNSAGRRDLRNNEKELPAVVETPIPVTIDGEDF